MHQRCFLPLLILTLTATAGCTDPRYANRRDAGGSDEDARVEVPDGCVQQCSGRVCGPDPACGASCGTCSDGTCNASGQCEGPTTPGGPVFLSFGADTTQLTPAASLTVTAVLTDPDGIDDLVGGSLVDASSGATYGAFATAAAEGAYEISIDWDDVNRASPIDIAPLATATRTVRAEFFDQSGNRATRELALELSCGSSVIRRAEAGVCRSSFCAEGRTEGPDSLCASCSSTSCDVTFSSGTGAPACVELGLPACTSCRNGADEVVGCDVAGALSCVCGTRSGGA